MAHVGRLALTLLLAIVLMLTLSVRFLQAEGLSEKMRARVLEGQAEFIAAAATAINWFGDARGLNDAAIEDYIAAERAQRRVNVVQLIMTADLSADGTVLAAEVARLSPALSPQTRGRLIASHALVDADGDGIVTMYEAAGLAGAEALRLVSEKRAEVLRVLLIFDLNGDEWVNLDEVREAIADLAA